MDIFETPTAIDPNTDYLAELVGEGKKFADVQALARAKAESDRMIATVLAEKRQLEADLRDRVSMQDFLDQMKKPVTAQPQPEPVIIPATAPAPTPDIEVMIQKQIGAREAENAKNRNLLAVQEKLQQTLGVNFSEQVKQRAQTLGLDIQYVNETAARSPQAFYALMGLTQSTPTPVLPKPGVNPPVQVDKSRNFAFFNAMRKSSPTEYHSAAVQKEMFERAKDPSFFE